MDKVEETRHVGEVVISTLRPLRSGGEEEKSQTKTTRSEISPPGPLMRAQGRNDIAKLNSEELLILRQLYQFPEVVLKAAQEYAPNHICTYLHNLAQYYNTFYNQHSILSADNQSQIELRLGLTAATAQVIKNGLNLLGIEAPEKM